MKCDASVGVMLLVYEDSTNWYSSSNMYLTTAYLTLPYQRKTIWKAHCYLHPAFELQEDLETFNSNNTMIMDISNSITVVEMSH